MLWLSVLWLGFRQSTISRFDRRSKLDILSEDFNVAGLRGEEMLRVSSTYVTVYAVRSKVATKVLIQ